MFFTLPLTHDRTVHGPPVVTFGIIAVCTLVWMATAVIETEVEAELGTLETELALVVQQYPKARVAYHIEGLPPQVRDAVFEPLVDDDVHRTSQPGDEELDAVLRRVVDALNRMPTIRLGYRPAAPALGALFASMWLHAGFMHLFGNMVFLFIAGTVIESRFTRLRYFVLYVVSGLAATLCHAFVEYDSIQPLVGASGAISAVLAMSFVLHPRTRITFGYLLFFFVIKRGTFKMPSWVCIPGWAAMQVVDAIRSNGTPVAHFAHVGGFAFGLAAALVLHQSSWLEDDLDALGPTEYTRPA